ncbi:COP23 domain-containing protein [Roseofilum sp. BLCC_M91]|uniref:COP23 domain-containing protein n=1 Tax=Roseofilum halophilum BLCC-M91 TaxID=3022259 RepID=A0ABT7BML5_9CYAN|nr:COP23 domain-containing protein [Roseofilum halophilum]MDJ1180438.1 COP23 domain-containing protein [Roseofilum halophilum BLCC-M91]
MMNLPLSNLFRTGAQLLSVVSLTALSIALPQPSQAQSARFYCGTSQGSPATLANTPRGVVPVIVWQSPYFEASGYSPQRRCQEVSSRFQTFYSKGSLEYLTTGIVNGYPVICVSQTNGGSCADTEVLFTLKQGDDANRVLQQMFDVRSGASGPLYQSTGRRPTKLYIDMENYLNTAPVESGSSPSVAPSQPQPAPNPAPANNPGSGSGGSVW